MTSYDITLATCAVLPDPDVDEEPLMEALNERGLQSRICVWDDPGVDWGESQITLIRSTWDYYRKIDAYRAWVEHVDGCSTLFNPAKAVLWNAHKRYLLELSGRGVATIPTQLVAKGAKGSLEEICEATGWKRVVVKPAVSAGSFQTYVMERGRLDEGVFEKLVETRDVLVQPYMTSVDTYGERCLVYLDGEFSHCVRKEPRFVGDEERVTGPHEIDELEVEVARAAIGCVGEELLYARVDLIRDDRGCPVVAELEIIEPSLFLPHREGSARRLAQALERRLRR